MAEHYGLQTAAGHLTVSQESKDPYAADQLAALHADAEQIIARYPQKRSALLPLLHLVQSVDGYVTGRGIDFCAEVLDLTRAEVSGVATFYTQYKRHPNGEYTVGVCTNTLCAVMGGDEIWASVSEHLGIGHDETTEDGKITLERVECNAACDYAPVVMANWEFFDNQTPESTNQLVDDLRAGKDVAPSRGPSKVCTFKQVSRVLAGFHDGLADEGVGAGPASLRGVEVAKEHGWTAPAGAAPEPVVAEPEANEPAQAAQAAEAENAPTEAAAKSADGAAATLFDAEDDATDDANQSDDAKDSAKSDDAGAAGFTPSRFGDGTVEAAADGSGPQGWDIKGNSNSMLFHTPASPYYGRTKAEVWFRDEAAATAAGFTNVLDRKNGTKNGKDES